MKNLKNKLLITVTILILLSSNILAIDYTWHCKGDVVSSTIYGWSSTSGNPWASFGFENNSDALPNLYGEIDNANCAFSYWDDRSPVCGGDGTSNILIEAYCDSSLGSGCWDVLLGVGENPLMEIAEPIFAIQFSQIPYLSLFKLIKKNYLHYIFNKSFIYFSCYSCFMVYI